MNASNSRSRCFLVALALAGMLPAAILGGYSGYRWLFNRGGATLAGAAQADGQSTAGSLLSDAEARRVTELVNRLMNPSESAEAAAQLHDLMDGQLREQAASGPATLVFFAECLAPKFAGLDRDARLTCLAMLEQILDWFGQTPASCWDRLLSPSKQILSCAIAGESVEVTLAALEIVRKHWEWDPSNVATPAERRGLGGWKADLHERCAELLQARDIRIRAAAGATVVSVPIDAAAEKGLVLLRDQSPYVRRTVLLALSDRSELLASDDVLPFLNDADPKVRTAADVVLTCRGLSREQISLAVRATNPSPHVRAQAPRYIVESTAIDRAVWLAQLSRDPSTTVRSESARALAVVGDGDCLARLAEMAASDPDAQVRQLASELVRGANPSPTAAAGPSNPEPVTLPPLRAPRAN